MKGFLIFALCIVAVKGQMEAVAKCAMSEGVTAAMKDEVMNALKNGGEPPKNFKCFLGCIADGLKIVSGNTFNAATFKSTLKGLGKLDDNQIKVFSDALEECSKSVKTTDRCERTWQLVKCAGTKGVQGVNMAGMG